MKNDDKVTTEAQGKRRKLLKAITAGGAAAAVVPAEWAKPLVKATVLPAHAQATVTGDCGINNHYFQVETGADGSMYMSLTARALTECGGSAQVDVIDSSGGLVFSCIQAANGSPVLSWSCSASTTPGTVTEGDDITFVVSFSNGCSCSVVRVAS